MPVRVSPTDRIRHHIDELFADGRSLPEILEEVYLARSSTARTNPGGSASLAGRPYVLPDCFRSSIGGSSRTPGACTETDHDPEYARNDLSANPSPDWRSARSTVEIR